MNGGIGDRVVTIQTGTVPPGRIGGRGISLIKKIQNSLRRMGRLAHLVVVQDKFAQTLIEAARTFKNCLAQALRNRGRVGIERGLAVAAVSRPEAGADALVRIGLGLETAA